MQNKKGRDKRGPFMLFIPEGLGLVFERGFQSDNPSLIDGCEGL